MEILLLEDVPKVGEEGEILEVANGFARNYLIPKGLARKATPGIKKQAEQIRKAAMKRRRRQRESSEALAERIAAVTLRFEVKVGETGRLYGSVTSADIVEQLSDRLGQDIDRRQLELPESIRQLGTYEIPLRLMRDLVPTVRVEVVGEGGMTIESVEGELQQQEALKELIVDESAAEPVGEAEGEAAEQSQSSE